MATPNPVPFHRVFLSVLALTLPTLAAIPSCTQDTPSGSRPMGDSDGPLDGQGAGGGGGAGGATSNDCSTDGPGCACGTEGQHLICGNVVSKINGQTMCGQGVSVCTNGKWAECILTGAAPIPLEDAPEGYYKTQGLGNSTKCANNPCDPYCFHYPDSPDSDVADAGTNLQVTDGGLGTKPDAQADPCTPLTCAKLGKNCGPVGDGCLGTINCGSCSGGLTCGGGGTPNVCGTFPIQPCVPSTCAQLGKNCGPVGDGCGGLLQCGTCSGGQTCGGGGIPSVCGVPTPPGGFCQPKTCAVLGKDCGPVGDGCGGLLQCGSCSGQQICGGGGVPSVCGGTTCQPKTCAQLGKNCGSVADGCGGVLSCGSCQSPQICGGGGTANVCGSNGLCTGLCTQQVACPGNGKTTLSGTIYAPNGNEPLPNVVVYVPNGPVADFNSGVTCDKCADPGSALVNTTTGPDGTFLLENVPVGANIPLVIQIGRWRRQVVVPSVGACVNTVLPKALSSLPKSQAEGDIPRIAISTGAVDGMECVLRKIGIAQSEFTAPGYSGRVHLYNGVVSSGARSPQGTASEANLLGSPSTLDDYDMILFPCQGSAHPGNATTKTREANLAEYANKGGRVFATHFSYSLLLTSGSTYYSPLSAAVNWGPGQNSWDGPLTGFISLTANSRPKALADWLVLPSVGASTTLGQIPVSVIRRDYNSVNSPTLNWMSLSSSYSNTPIHLTFDTPINVPAAQQCGRVVFSDFHVVNISTSSSTVFPGECPGGGMTAQEKLLEYMLFDLASCVGNTAPPPQACTKLTCADLGITCGQAGDGCGGPLTCGPACPAPTCKPTATCAAQGLSCGQTGDGCGGVLNCGTCPSGQTCGGGGVPGQCGAPPPCVPKGCPNPGVACGQAGDGCGGLLNCGCNAPATCGGDGKPGVCAQAPACVKTTCAAQGISCGQAGDGCGGVLQCGSCTLPQTCGGGGVPGQCGALTVYTDGYFSRDYEIKCPSGTAPFWQLWSWTAMTPSDTSIDFKVQTAATKAGLDAAPADTLLFSMPPGPSVLAGQTAKAHAANVPPGSPDTQSGSASVDSTLLKAGRQRNYPYLRVISHLAPSTDKHSQPLLNSWDMQVDCIPSE